LIRAVLFDFWDTLVFAERQENDKLRRLRISAWRKVTYGSVKATVWAYDYRRLGQKFEKATGESLRSGMRVMLPFTDTMNITMAVMEQATPL
jgi:hypothetical protein